MSLEKELDSIGLFPVKEEPPSKDAEAVAVKTEPEYVDIEITVVKVEFEWDGQKCHTRHVEDVINDYKVKHEALGGPEVLQAELTVGPSGTSKRVSLKQDSTQKTKRNRGSPNKINTLSASSRQVTQTHQSHHACDLCKRKFITEKSLNIHRQQHFHLTIHKCEICRIIFACKYSLALHNVKIHAKARPKPVKIMPINYKFGFPKSIHWKKKSQDVNKMFPVKATGNILNILGPKRPYSCDICKKSFALSSALDKHSYIHKTENLIRLRCTICKKLFSDNKPFVNHMKKHTVK